MNFSFKGLTFTMPFKLNVSLITQCCPTYVAHLDHMFLSDVHSMHSAVVCLSSCFELPFFMWSYSFDIKLKGKLWAFILYMCCHTSFSHGTCIHLQIWKVICLTGWCCTLLLDSVSSVRNPCELNALDQYRLKLRLTVSFQLADWNKKEFPSIVHCLNIASFM
jgi:hypothetical protein